MTTAIELIKMLYNESFFASWRSFQEVKEALQKKGFNFSDPLILVSLRRASSRGLLSKKTEDNRVKFSQKVPPQIKIKEKDIEELNSVLSEITKKKLGDRFQQDIRELY